MEALMQAKQRHWSLDSPTGSPNGNGGARRSSLSSRHTSRTERTRPIPPYSSWLGGGPR
ncbi:hypothetical protein HEB94_000778 [Actinopolymorpha pittospori]|uniref:Uncharacterized protein n=1 Tax=Actinopolymorpha pittospori TaxID=648752 RepID=A0A927R9F5_9ACTN|nr:hypothetical protein [Actinopolymorpha pittospori]